MISAAIELAIAVAPPDRRPALTALFALDARLGSILQSTREPMVGQLRLTWWRDALERLDHAPPPAEPVLADVARLILPFGVSGAALAEMTTGWEALLTAPDLAEPDAMEAFARLRGGGLFAAAATILGTQVPAVAGEGWALADLAGKLTVVDAANQAAWLARDRLAAAFTYRFARRARPLGVLALLAGFDLRGARPVSDAISLVGFRLTGRHRLEIDERDDSLGT